MLNAESKSAERYVQGGVNKGDHITDQTLAEEPAETATNEAGQPSNPVPPDSTNVDGQGNSGDDGAENQITTQASSGVADLSLKSLSFGESGIMNKDTQEMTNKESQSAS